MLIKNNLESALLALSLFSQILFQPMCSPADDVMQSPDYPQLENNNNNNMPSLQPVFNTQSHYTQSQVPQSHHMSHITSQVKPKKTDLLFPIVSAKLVRRLLPKPFPDWVGGMLFYVCPSIYTQEWILVGYFFVGYMLICKVTSVKCANFVLMLLKWCMLVLQLCINRTSMSAFDENT